MRATDSAPASSENIVRQIPPHLSLCGFWYRLFRATLLGRRRRVQRTLNKRYGCIFTCLRYRAVHIKVASDLFTDSFINALSRFFSRRSPPRVIYSDNGTNFRGANPDILKALKECNQERINYELRNKGIQWNFNPPAASHQGGVWERLIRAVRRI